jgi:hypothetical protein
LLSDLKTRVSCPEWHRCECNFGYVLNYGARGIAGPDGADCLVVQTGSHFGIVGLVGKEEVAPREQVVRLVRSLSMEALETRASSDSCLSQ